MAKEPDRRANGGARGGEGDGDGGTRRRSGGEFPGVPLRRPSSASLHRRGSSSPRPSPASRPQLPRARDLRGLFDVLGAARALAADLLLRLRGVDVANTSGLASCGTSAWMGARAPTRGQELVSTRNDERRFEPL